MTRRLFALLPLLTLLAACRSVGGPTDQEPRSPGHTPPAGFRSIGYHGVAVDVPDAAVLTTADRCRGEIAVAGPVVVPLFEDGTASCPPQRDPVPKVSPRPATDVTVVLGPDTDDLDLPLSSPTTVTLAGVRVTVAGSADVVRAVVDSVREIRSDDNGCTPEIDPTVALRNIESPDGSLLPVATSRVQVCQYATVARGSGYWLVGSRELTDDEATALVARLDAAPAATPGGSGSALTPVLRLRVLGADGNTRTLQADVGGDSQTPTDGRNAVTVRRSDGGRLPTPFDGG